MKPKKKKPSPEAIRSADLCRRLEPDLSLPELLLLYPGLAYSLGLVDFPGGNEPCHPGAKKKTVEK